MKYRKAFTLIELLVVIAIIAILAAILFPVFAQAKAAAKKTAALSSVKQMNTGAALYQSDSDDTYMTAYAYLPGDGWQDNKAARVPSNWNPAWSDAEVRAYENTWANSMQPYLKSRDLLHAPGETVKDVVGVSYANPRAKPEWSNYAFNGNLTEYSATAIAAPSNLIAFWQANGLSSYRGYAVTSPFLVCDKADQPCKYVPTSSACDESQNGNWDYYQIPNAGALPVIWSYGRGINVAFADGSARYRRVGMNVKGKTDYRTDPFSQYAEDGTVPGAAGWYDEFQCHSMQFRPEFDFQNWGSPIEL